MKARVKATGYIIDVELYYITPRIKTYIDGTQYYNSDELDFNIEYDDPNYWTCLEHQYAGMAMQGILACEEWKISPRGGVSFAEEVALQAREIAHALVEKMKEESK